MPAAYSDDLKERIAHWHLDEHKSVRETAALAHVSVGLVAKVAANMQDFGQVVNPYSQRTGAPCAAEDEDLEYLREVLESSPTLFLDELQQKLETVRNTQLSISTISRMLHRINLTHKGVSRHAAQRNEELRATWRARMGAEEYQDPALFVFLDESAVDDKTFQRTSGWSEVDTPCVARAAFLRSIRHSVLPALSIDGIIALDIFEGSVTKERFLGFIEQQVAPMLNPFPQERSVVILDNCSIHHDAELRRIIVDECGAQLVYLPPYSPDMNPIEEAFNALKAALRRHERMYTGSQSLQWLVTKVLAEITSDHALGWFRDSGYM